MNVDALRQRLDELAVDVGRIRQRVAPETSLGWTLDRIARHIESLVLMVEPSAGEIAAIWAPGDDEAIHEAIRIVDARSRRLRERLGYRATA